MYIVIKSTKNINTTLSNRDIKCGTFSFYARVA